MQTLRVAAISMNSELGKREQTLNRIADFCEQAAAKNVELVLSPELVVHGRCTPNRGAMIIVPNGDIIHHAQTERICDDLIVCDLDTSLLAEARSHPNYTMWTRRPELFGDLAKQHVSRWPGSASGLVRFAGPGVLRALFGDALPLACSRRTFYNRGIR